MKKFTNYITEALAADDPIFEGMVDDIRNMIDETIKKSGGDDVKTFAKEFLRKPTEVKIEGLINDDQVYDFWLKYENEIDELLNKVDFFKESPDKLNSIGVYKYIMTATNRAILESIRKLAE